jgi:SAM-dependent methyltransferase
LDDLNPSGKRVLEIGLGQGADSEQLIRRAARWSGIDITYESVERVGIRMALHDLPYDNLIQGSVLALPWPDDSFDMVFSHGVLHHVPEILGAQSEIHRILKPDGELVVMLYARRSLNYLVSILFVRRALLLVAAPFAELVGLTEGEGLLAGHLRNARREGVWHYLRRDRILHASTDGPDNPFSRVYSAADVRRDFPFFEVVRSHRHFMHAPPLPVHGVPLEHLLGWHLWVHMRPRNRETIAP